MKNRVTGLEVFFFKNPKTPNVFQTMVYNALDSTPINMAVLFGGKIRKGGIVLRMEPT